MLRDELIRIVKIFQNDGIDGATGKKVSGNQVADFMDFFDDNVNHEAGVEIVFEPETYGLPKDATAEQIVDFALQGELDNETIVLAGEIQEEGVTMSLQTTLNELRDRNDEFSFEQKQAVQICMLKLGEVLVKCFADEEIVQEYEQYMQTGEAEMPQVKAFLDGFDDTCFSYALSYLAEEMFVEMMIVYTLLNFEKIIADVECKNMILNYNYLMNISVLLEEKAHQYNHSQDSIFSGFGDYKYDEKIAEININLETKELEILGVTEEIEKISEIELKEFLSKVLI